MKFRRWVALGCILMEIGPGTWAANIPFENQPKPVRMAILRIGPALDESGERAYRLVETRLKRWLENLDALRAKVEPTTLSLAGAEGKLERERAQLALLSQQLSDAMEGKTPTSPTENARLRSVVLQMDGLRQQLSPVTAFGPVVQRALLVEAAFLWKEGARREAISYLEHAIALHPEGLVENPVSWDQEASSDASSLSAELSRLGSRVRRPCHLELETSAPPSRLSINGFEFGKRKDFQLHAGGPYVIWVEAPGYQPAETHLTCSRQEKRRLSVSLVPKKTEAVSSAQSLDKLMSRTGVESFCLIDSRGDGFRFYLYTPNQAMEEIPMQRPLRVAEVLGAPSDATLPIASDAFLGILEKHRMASLLPQGDGLGMGALRPIDATLVEQAGHRQWYNNWVFWTVAGGVLGGLLVTYLATRQDTVRTRSGLTVRVD